METNNNIYVMGRFSDKQDAVLELDRASYVDDVVLDTDESRARVAEASKYWSLVEERFASPTPEEFFAEGTTPLAETNAADGAYVDMYKHAAPAYLTSEQVKEESERLINEVIDPIVEQAAIELGFATAKAVKVDGDRIQLTEAQMSGVVGEVLTQTITGDPQGLGYRKGTGVEGFIGGHPVYVALSKRIAALEETQTKLIAALKHLGLDTNKHFR